MKAVSRFEANLLRVLRGVLLQTPAEHLAPVLDKPLPRPKCLSRDTVALIEDSLRKGCVQWLAKRAWMRERFLRDGKPVAGRLWERTAPAQLGLTFSPAALEFLVQLVSGTIGASVPKVEDATIGDRLLCCLTFDTLKATAAGEVLRKKWTPLHEDGLCRLAFLDELGDVGHRFRIDWRTWTSGPGTSVLETLQGWLAERWLELERKKETISTPARMRKIGATQERVFGEYLDALDGAERRDLARCFLDAARRLLPEPPSARRWIARLDVTRERLADRQRLYLEALAFVRQLERLRTWQRQALGVGYSDEGYPASQLWKADWERFDGDRLCAHADAIVREVEPI